MTQTNPTRDEAVQSPLDIAMDALFDVRRAIFNADPAVLTDTLWMPEDTYKGGTVVDFIENAMGRVRSLASAPAPASGRVDAVADWIDGQRRPILALYRFDNDDDLRRAHEAFAILSARLRCASLSPAATPVSEAEPNWLQIETALAAPENAENVKRWMAALAKPASSPAGGDVVEALREALTWHEAEDKALSKSGRGDTDYYWRRAQHQEQMENLRAALSQSTSAGRVGE